MMILANLMFLQVIFSIEAPIANRAVMQIFASMQFEMHIVVSLIKEMFVACSTHISVVRQVSRSVKCHCIVAFEFLLAYGTWKLLIWVFMFSSMSVESIFFETGKAAVFIRAFKWLFQAMRFRHVTDFG